MEWFHSGINTDSYLSLWSFYPSQAGRITGYECPSVVVCPIYKPSLRNWGRPKLFGLVVPQVVAFHLMFFLYLLVSGHLLGQLKINGHTNLPDSMSKKLYWYVGSLV